MAFRRKRSCAIWETLTGHEFAPAPEFPHEWSAAERTPKFFRGLAERCRLVQFFFRLNILSEWSIKIFKCLFIFSRAHSDIIELVFHLCGKRVADVWSKMLFKKSTNNHAGICRLK